jgi:hypothetical protein
MERISARGGTQNRDSSSENCCDRRIPRTRQAGTCGDLVFQTSHWLTRSSLCGVSTKDTCNQWLQHPGTQSPGAPLEPEFLRFSEICVIAAPGRLGRSGLLYAKLRANTFQSPLELLPQSRCGPVAFFGNLLPGETSIATFDQSAFFRCQVFPDAAE